MPFGFEARNGAKNGSVWLDQPVAELPGVVWKEKHLMKASIFAHSTGISPLYMSPFLLLCNKDTLRELEIGMPLSCLSICVDISLYL